MSNARKGKVARLPYSIRHDINQHLKDGISGSEIIQWLNKMPEVKAVMKKRFGGRPINAQNLSEWRKGGYAEWLLKSTQYEEARQTTDHAQYICSSLGLDPSDALSVIMTGHLVRLLSGDAALEDVAKLGPLFNAVTNVKKVGLQERKLELDDESLDLAKKRFQRDTAELFIKFYENKKAVDVVEDSGKSIEEKTELLGQLIFEEDW